MQGTAVVVEGKHEERADDHGYISRHFVRRYVLPEHYNMEQLNSSLSSDGVLTITAPKKVTIGLFGPCFANKIYVVGVTHSKVNNCYTLNIFWMFAKVLLTESFLIVIFSESRLMIVMIFSNCDFRRCQDPENELS